MWLSLLLSSVAVAEEPAEVAFASAAVVFLRPGTVEVEGEELARLQKAHRAYLGELEAAGSIRMCGPFDGGSDPSLEGICVYAVPVAEARALAEADPAAVAGLLTVDTAELWYMADRLAFPHFESLQGTKPEGAHDGHHAGGDHAGGDHATVRHRFDDVERWVSVFDDPERDAWQKPDVLVNALGIRPRQVVADIGAGTGYFNRHLAEAVGKKGRVIAIDIEPGLVGHMARRALADKLLQVEPRLGSAADPGLAEAEVDLVLLVDTYHHIDDRKAYFGALQSRLRPGGRLVVVDFKKDPAVTQGPPLDHRLDVSVVDKELTEAGWVLLEAPEILPAQYVRIYGLSDGS